MKTIRDLLARNLEQKIEEIIKVDQTDEQSVYTEITEYVATDRITDQYRDLLRAVAEAPAEPHEGVGVWISGFFGSGKSSFAKNLGYVLANRPVLGHKAAELFKTQVQDRRISELAHVCLDYKRSLDTTNETSHVFHLPALLQVGANLAFAQSAEAGRSQGSPLRERVAAWQARVAEAERQLAEYQREIDEIAFRLYDIEGDDRRAIEEVIGSQSSVVSEEEGGNNGTEEETEAEITADARGLVADLLSYTLGCSFGRWDVRFATSERPTPELPDPFAPLPVCSPGMLTSDDGLPLRETSASYPLQIDWDGIFVDDPDHSDDIIRRVHEVLDIIWGERAEAIEREACNILGVKELRDYFRKPGNGGFWLDHVKRYSKSRRKAPIYWLLQSSKKNYALWLYYHRLDKDILFKALVNYVEPKLRLEESRLEQLRTQRASVGISGREAKQLEKQLDRQETVLSELRDFHDKLRRAADLHLEPDLNDGVVLNIAPLWELVPWNEAKTYWEELLAGKYEWSSIGKQLRQKGLVGKG
jgi:hypothetical protein